MFENQVKSTPLSIAMAADPLFSLPLGEEEIKWTVWLSRENIWKRFRTLGQVAVLDGNALEVSCTFRIQSLPVLDYSDIVDNTLVLSATEYSTA